MARCNTLSSSQTNKVWCNRDIN